MSEMEAMNASTTCSWNYLRVSGQNLPKTGIAFSTLLLQILIIQFFVQIVHTFVFARFHLTPIVTQMFVGISLSQTSPWGDNAVHDTLHALIFPGRSQIVGETLAMLSYMIYTFLIAVKIDYSIVLKTGRKAFVIGVLDVIIPLMADLWLITYIYPDLFQRLKDKDQEAKDLFINLTIMPLAPYPNIFDLLSDMKLINSELGRLALSSSLIGYTISVFLLVTSIDVIRPDKDLVTLAAPVVLLLVSVFILRPIFQWMVKQTPKGRPVRTAFVFSGVLLMLVGGLTTQFYGRVILLGVFIVGSVIPGGPPLGSVIVEKLDFLVSGIFLPFCVTTVVMSGDYSHVGTTNQAMFHHLCLVIFAYLAKFFNSLVCGLYCEMGFTDALSLSFIMSTKGIVDICTLSMFRQAQALSTRNYTVMILWTMMVAMHTPVFVKHLYHPMKKYAGFQRRDITHCKYNSELRILVSFMRSDSVNSMTRLLNACCPSENNPIIVYALHLVKMVGRAHPIFIAHDLQKKKDSRNSFSEDVIRAFHRFQQKSNGFISVSIYTGMSPTHAMHEDVCTLALDKLVSIIVLPFHRRFMLDGSMEFEDIEQKTLNYDLLNRSPCSIGILVDRCSFDFDSTTPLMVAVIYVGGLDDQETLAFAKRIATDSRVRVDVIRLVAIGESCDLDSVDSAALMDIQKNVLYSNQFSYTEKAVKDGADTSVFIWSLVDSYNLIMVGRHYNYSCTQLMGLQDMSENTQLGALGDLLASQDLQSQTSVLVVQQQRHWGLEKPNSYVAGMKL